MRDLMIDELEHVYGGGGRGGDWGKPKPPQNKTSHHGRKSSRSRKQHGRELQGLEAAVVLVPGILEL